MSERHCVLPRPRSRIQHSDVFIVPYSEAHAWHLDEVLRAELPHYIKELSDKAVESGQQRFTDDQRETLLRSLTRSAVGWIQKIDEDGRGKVFLAFARQSRNIVGLIGVMLDSELISPRTADILMVGVVAPCRRQGLGKLLVDYVCLHMKRNCVVEQVFVTVDTKHELSVNFCRAVGFTNHCYVWSFPCRPCMARFHRMLGS